MKKLLYIILIIFSVRNAAGQDLKPEYQKFIKSFISNVKSNNKEGVATFISFPLGRDYPIPNVKNKNVQILFIITFSNCLPP